MAAYFFYGTLLDPELRRVVLGRPLPPGAVVPAVLRGYRRVAVAGRGYPALVPDPRARTEGVLATGLDEAMAARISYYESDDYDIEMVVVEARGLGAVPARVFVPTRAMPLSPAPWDLELWRRRFRRRAIAGARAAMAALARPEARRVAGGWRARRRLPGIHQD